MCEQAIKLQSALCSRSAIREAGQLQLLLQIILTLSHTIADREVHISSAKFDW